LWAGWGVGGHPPPNRSQANEDIFANSSGAERS
jgi:hypothetical protein